jgi:hypothetical protein
MSHSSPPRETGDGLVPCNPAGRRVLWGERLQVAVRRGVCRFQHAHTPRRRGRGLGHPVECTFDIVRRGWWMGVEMTGSPFTSGFKRRPLDASLGGGMPWCFGVRVETGVDPGSGGATRRCPRSPSRRRHLDGAAPSLPAGRGLDPKPNTTEGIEPMKSRRHNRTREIVSDLLDAHASGDDELRRASSP